MLIPLYVLIGVWGGAGRLGATIKFVVYTVAGSLRTLAVDRRLRLPAGHVRPDEDGVELDDWLFLGFVAVRAIKAPLFRSTAGCRSYRESPPRCRRCSRGHLEGRLTASCGSRSEVPAVAHDFRVDPRARLVALVYGSLLAFRARTSAGRRYSSLAQMGLITFGLFAANDLGFDGAVLQMVNHA
jgi:NADH-quinone oxidoreductase subunit M